MAASLLVYGGVDDQFDKLGFAATVPTCGATERGRKRVPGLRLILSIPCCCNRGDVFPEHWGYRCSVAILWSKKERLGWGGGRFYLESPDGEWFVSKDRRMGGTFWMAKGISRVPNSYLS